MSESETNNVLLFESENGVPMSESAKNDPPMSESASAQTVPASSSAQTGEGGKGSEEKRRKIIRSVSAVLFAAIFLLVGLIAGWFAGVSTVDGRARNLAWLLERVADNYYKEIDDEELYDRLYSALELDKFCSYYNVDEYDKLVDESQGRNEGYGISLLYEENKVLVYRAVYNSPVELAGLEPGMQIFRYGLSADSLQTATPDNFFDDLSTHDSCAVEFGFTRESAQIQTITRAAYAASYCEYRDSEKSFRFRGEKSLSLTEVGGGMPVLDGDTAYIRLTEFDGNAADEFRACLDEMKSRGRKHLILDLRSNGGGYLSTLCDIASHLLKDAEGNRPLVATSRYRSGATDRYLATGNDYDSYFSADSRIRILADENSASASEALIGAMYDYHTVSDEDIYLRVSMLNGKEVAKTYGKGVMQSTFVAPNGRALRLTVAEIFWPNGNSIHDVGIRAEGEHAVHADPLASAEDFLSRINL